MILFDNGKVSIVKSGATFTHVGFRREMASKVHRGKLYGHGDYAGAVHALNGTKNTYDGARYMAVCGKEVMAESDHHGDFNVVPGSAGVTCKKCQKLMAK